MALSLVDNWAQAIKDADYKVLARAISLIENSSEGYRDILLSLKPNNSIPIIGFTGPPGAGKSTLVNALLEILVNQHKKVAIIAIDPSSPFNFGALLGDRVRMETFYNSPNIFIRSMASRGSLGGLSDCALEVCDLCRCSNFDYIFVETVGVGQSEVEIASLADACVLISVPQSGDEIQALKAGIMEIADVHVVNKADDQLADKYVEALKQMLQMAKKETAVLKTIASENVGIPELWSEILQLVNSENLQKNQLNLLVKKAYKYIQKERMTDIDITSLALELEKAKSEKFFNIYSFAESKK